MWCLVALPDASMLCWAAHLKHSCHRLAYMDTHNSLEAPQRYVLQAYTLLRSPRWQLQCPVK